MDYTIGVKLNAKGEFEPYNEVMREILLDDLKTGEYYEFKPVKMSDNKKRTILQNNAMHLFFKKLANRLNDAGFDKRTVLNKMKEGFMLWWTPKGVKEDIWYQMQMHLTGKESTAKLDRDEVSEIYKGVNVFTLERLGFSEPFPSMDGMLFDQEKEQRKH